MHEAARLGLNLGRTLVSHVLRPATRVDRPGMTPAGQVTPAGGTSVGVHVVMSKDSDSPQLAISAPLSCFEP